jgi:hypothetical protein
MNFDKYKPNREFLLYKTESGEVKVDVLLQNKTIWMSQKTIVELFDVNVPAKSKHLKFFLVVGNYNTEHDTIVHQRWYI